MRRDSPDRLTEGCTAFALHQGSMVRSYPHSVTFTSLNSIKGQWCAADSVLSLQQVHLVVTTPCPLTITSHRAPLVHNSCTSHPSYLHACNNWGEQCHPTPSVTPNTSQPRPQQPPSLQSTWLLTLVRAKLCTKQAAKRWPVLLPRCWPGLTSDQCRYV